MHRQSWFATLTYDDQHVPSDGSLDYSHVQAFHRRLRKSIGPFRFFCAGEYGSRTRRPHYHSAIFGLALSDVRYLCKSPSGNTLWESPRFTRTWGLGFTSLGLLSFESASYVASYVCKKATGPNAEKTYKRLDPETGELYSVEPEFAHMSLKPGIGSTWFDKFAGDCLPRDHVIIDGRKIPVPRYYFDLFKKVDPFAADEIEFDRSQKIDYSERSPARLKARHTVALAAQSLKLRKL